MTRQYTDIMVCYDCYVAHHYGATCMSREANGDLYGPWTAEERAELIGDHDWVWYAGDSDTPCEAGEPLSEIGDAVHVTDNTCSDHDGSEGWTDDENACTHCGQPGYETGITEFSWSRCQGCGSTLGGSRYRLAIWQ